MKMRRLWSWIAIVCLLAIGAGARSDDLPEDARKIVADLDQKIAAIQKRVNERIKGPTEKYITSLQQMQDTYTKAGKLDEAVAIRDQIRALKAGVASAQPDPGQLIEFRDKVGQSFYFEVTGRRDGPVWGTDVYTDDSELAVAVVHAGILREGQKGIVKVTILAGQDRYDGTDRNGVSSESYENWDGSYKVEAVK